jgi:hypothetical protein
MNCDEIRSFYQAALTAGAILSGFNGSFISFRIQREANYYRLPAYWYNEKAQEGEAKWVGDSVDIRQSHFTTSFFLIILGTICSMWFGVWLPLSVLAGRRDPRPAMTLAGLAASAVLVMAYFLDELIHYEILTFKWSGRIRDLECLIVISGILLACLIYCIVLCH